MKSDFDSIGKNLQINEYEFPPRWCVYAITRNPPSDFTFKENFLKLLNNFYDPTGQELKVDPTKGTPYWIIVSEDDLEETIPSVTDKGKGIAAYILLVLHFNNSKPSEELNRSATNTDQNYGEIVAFDIRDKYVSYEVIEALRKRAEYTLWKHNIQENNKYRFI